MDSNRWVAILVVLAAVALGISIGHQLDHVSRPGFYCNGTNGVYYTHSSLVVDPYDPSCGGIDP